MHASCTASCTYVHMYNYVCNIFLFLAAGYNSLNICIRFILRSTPAGHRCQISSYHIVQHPVEMSTDSLHSNGMSNRKGLKTSNSNSESLEKRAASTATSSSPAPGSHGTLMVLFFSLLVDLLGFTVILPLIPSMLEYYSKNDQVST